MKSVFITGANRGLGYGFVEYFLNHGYQVFAGTRKIVDTLPHEENLVWVECDVTNDSSIDAAFTLVKSQARSLAFLINNAGVNKNTIAEGNKDSVSKLGCLDRHALVNMFNINSISPLMVTQKFIPLLKSSPCYIINISSSRASFNDYYGQTTANYGYTASKVALNMLTFCSASELPNNIRTFAVNPGGVKTDMNPDAPNEPIVRAEKIIRIVDAWKDEYNGKFLHHDGALHPL